jgi:hypothetical protein
MSTSSDNTFTTLSESTSTSTATTTDMMGLQTEISRLRQLVQTLIDQLQRLISFHMNNPGVTWPGGGGMGGNTSSTATTTPSTGGSSSQATIEPANQTVRGGSSIDFGGRHFGIEEPVEVTSNGQVITTTHADGGGNFSTGSLSVPSVPGTKTYTFRGLNSGITVSQNITITP